jgi:hypothetical protein
MPTRLKLIRKLMSLDEELLRRIEDYRFRHRIRTDTETFRRLLEIGLRASRGSAPARRRRTVRRGA